MKDSNLAAIEYSRLRKRLLLILCFIAPTFAGLCLIIWAGVLSGVGREHSTINTSVIIAEMFSALVIVMFGFLFCLLPGVVVTFAMLFYRKHIGRLNVGIIAVMFFLTYYLLFTLPYGILAYSGFGNTTGMTGGIPSFSGIQLDMLVALIISIIAVCIWFCRKSIGLKLIGKET